MDSNIKTKTLRRCKMKQKEFLLLRKNLTIKFLALSFCLFIIFYYFYMEKLSKYFALVCALLFLGIALYYFLILRNVLIKLKVLSDQKYEKDIAELKEKGILK